MEKFYNTHKNVKINRGDYTGIVCGYKPNMVILAVEDYGAIKDRTWRRLDKDTYIDSQYKDAKYRYIYEDADYILKQLNLF